MGKRVAPESDLDWTEIAEDDDRDAAVAALKVLGVPDDLAAPLISRCEAALPKPDPNATEIRFHRLCLVHMRAGMAAAEAEKAARLEVGPKRVGRRQTLAIRPAILYAASFFHPAARKRADVRRAIYRLAVLAAGPEALGRHRYSNPARLVKETLAGVPEGQIGQPKWVEIYAEDVAAEVADDVAADLASGVVPERNGPLWPYEILHRTEEMWREAERAGEPLNAHRKATRVRLDSTGRAPGK